ncbi:SART-1 family protein DOT2 [Neltuma alba]|uniref:SART-1 family protein DOT2 n=1 Tax=Neltuma alba TaxID=207710 RepID=UPI0010A48F3F|nr:SART-1 family protein DOT2-like [Prosopis alba]XP_028798690.1 SART-1 family protein DOT2-like [Prosopis alba]
MDMEWSESRYEPRDGRDDQEDSALTEQYDDLEQVGTDKSSKHRSKDRKNSNRGEEKENRSKDRDKLKRTTEDVSKEREKEARDLEKDRIGSRERKREDRDEREKDRSKDSKLREKDYDRERYRDKDRERDKDKKERGKDKDREKEREMEKETDGGREKERGKEKARDRDRDKEKERDKAKERERERHRDREKDRESYRDGDKDKGKDKIRDKEREADQDKERSKNKGTRKTLEDDDYKVDIHDKRDEEVGKQGRASNLDQSDRNGEALAHPSAMELEERILKMKEARLGIQSEGATEILSWVSRSRKLEEKKNAEKEKAWQLSKIFEEQDNIALEESEDEGATQHATDNLAGVKVLHGLDKVMEGGTVVLTIKDQPILADGDINQDIDMLEHVEIGEQKRRDEAYKAAKKKTGVYDDKFNDDPTAEKKILPQYDDPAAEEGLTLDESGRFSREAEKKLDELRRRLTGVSTNTFEDLNSSGKVSSDYYTHEEMLQFKKPKKKKSLRKKEKLDLNALEAEAVSAGLGIGDLGSRNDAKRQAIKEEQERLEAEKRNDAYQSAYAKADEASRLLRLEQTLNVKTEEDEAPVFADDDDDLHKSLERARRLAIKKKEEEGASGPQAIALLASSNPGNVTVDNQNPTASESENKVVFTEMEEFVWGLQIDEEARKPESEDVFMHEDEEANAADEGKNDETGGWTEVKETSEDEKPDPEHKEEIVPDETIHEVAVGKGLSGALKLLKDRGTLKETVEWGGRNMDKKKSKLVGIVDDDESKDAHNKKEIRIERTDEFGRILTPKEAFRLLSHKFHGKGPGKMKQEKRMKQYYEELKMKQMKSSDTPSLSVERMRESQARLKTPYLVLSGHVKPGQTSDPKSGFATVEKDLPGGLTPMLGDRKVEHFLGIKRKAEPSSSNAPKKPKS